MLTSSTIAMTLLSCHSLERALPCVDALNVLSVMLASSKPSPLIPSGILWLPMPQTVLSWMTSSSNKPLE
eukprot:c25224_g3_i1 orf=215-424(-)